MVQVQSITPAALTEVGGALEVLGVFFAGSPALVELLGAPTGNIACDVVAKSGKRLSVAVPALPQGTYAIRVTQEGVAATLASALAVGQHFALPVPQYVQADWSAGTVSPRGSLSLAPAFAPVPDIVRTQGLSSAIAPYLANPSAFPTTFGYEGVLPAGLTFNPTTGVLAGIVTDVGSSQLRLVAHYTDVHGIAQTVRTNLFSITVVPPQFVPVDVNETFEVGTGWSRDFAPLTYSTIPDPDLVETFDNGTGWSGTTPAPAPDAYWTGAGGIVSGAIAPVVGTTPITVSDTTHVTVVPGVSQRGGPVINFSGGQAGGSVQINGALFNAPNYTFGGWFYAPGATSTQCFWRHLFGPGSGGEGVRTNPANPNNGYIGIDAIGSFSTTYPANVPHLVLVKTDVATANTWISVDGAPFALFVGDATEHAGLVVLGMANTDAPYELTGSEADLMFYARAISDAEARAIYNKTLGQPLA